MVISAPACGAEESIAEFVAAQPDTFEELIDRLAGHHDEIFRATIGAGGIEQGIGQALGVVDREEVWSRSGQEKELCHVDWIDFANSFADKFADEVTALAREEDLRQAVGAAHFALRTVRENPDGVKSLVELFSGCVTIIWRHIGPVDIGRCG